MAHIGIERFATCDSQHHSAQGNKRHPGLVEEHHQCVPGIDCGQDEGILDQRGQAKTAQGDEPDQHQGAEQFP
jgi:hypothetical protein